jgi:hypothetical protein
VIVSPGSTSETRPACLPRRSWHQFWWRRILRFELSPALVKTPALQRLRGLALRFQRIVPNRSREPLWIRARPSFCRDLSSRPTHSRAIPFCCPGFESSVEIVRPTHVLAMITEPTLTICLDASEVYELESYALCFVELVPCDIEGFEGVAFISACCIELDRRVHTRGRQLVSRLFSTPAGEPRSKGLTLPF